MNSPEEVGQVTVRDPEKVVWISQTTLSVDETLETVARLRERFPSLQDPPSDDICYATSIEEVETAKEDILFSLPKELRSALKNDENVGRQLGGRGAKPTR